MAGVKESMRGVWWVICNAGGFADAAVVVWGVSGGQRDPLWTFLLLSQFSVGCCDQRPCSSEAEWWDSWSGHSLLSLCRRQWGWERGGWISSVSKGSRGTAGPWHQNWQKVISCGQMIILINYPTGQVKAPECCPFPWFGLDFSIEIKLSSIKSGNLILM